MPEYDQPEHSFVEQSHPADSVGAEVNTLGQNSQSPPAKCDDDIWKSTPHEIKLIGPMGTEANLHALMPAKTPHVSRHPPPPAGSTFTHELSPAVLRASLDSPFFHFDNVNMCVNICRWSER